MIKTGDQVRIDPNKRSADILISKEEYNKRLSVLKGNGGCYPIPDHQTPWQEMQRGMVDELANSMVLRPAVKYQRIAVSKGMPRDKSLTAHLHSRQR